MASLEGHDRPSHI